MNVSQVTNDILNNPRFEGAISSISWLTDWIDVGFGMAITTVAFLIILVAMFKNVLAGAYCAYPRFWDGVHLAHESNKELGFIQNMRNAIQGGNGAVQSMAGSPGGGGLGMALMGLLPDIKVMTDFEGDTQSPKAYFIKAIPQMLVCVVIGAFIYNGYYRDVASIVVDTGSTLIQRTLLEFDPIAVYDQFTGTAGRPSFVSDDSVVPRDKLINQVSLEYYTAIIGVYTDITTAEQKRVLADAVEAKANEQIKELEAVENSFTNGEDWKMTTRMAWSLTDQYDELAKVRGYAQGSNNTIYQYGDCFSIDSLGISTVQNHPEYAFIRIIFTFQKQNVAAGTRSISDGVLKMGMDSTFEQASRHTGDSGNFLDITALNTDIPLVNENSQTVGYLTFTVGRGSNSQYQVSVKMMQGTASGTYKVGTGIRVISQDGHGGRVQHNITSVVLESSSTPEFYSASAEGATHYTFGMEATPAGILGTTSNPSGTNNNPS